MGVHNNKNLYCIVVVAIKCVLCGVHIVVWEGLVDSIYAYSLAVTPAPDPPPPPPSSIALPPP